MSKYIYYHVFTYIYIHTYTYIYNYSCFKKAHKLLKAVYLKPFVINNNKLHVTCLICST